MSIEFVACEIMNSKKKKDDEEKSSLDYTVELIEYMIDFFPNFTRTTPEDLSRKFEECQDDLVKHLFFNILSNYPSGFDEISELNEDTWKHLLDAAKKTGYDENLVNFAAGRMYLYYGQIDKAIKYFSAFLEHEVESERIDNLAFISYTFLMMDKILFNINEFRKLVYEKKELLTNAINFVNSAQSKVTPETSQKIFGEYPLFSIEYFIASFVDRILTALFIPNAPIDWLGLEQLSDQYLEISRGDNRLRVMLTLTKIYLNVTKGKNIHIREEERTKQIIALEKIATENPESIKGFIISMILDVLGLAFLTPYFFEERFSTNILLSHETDYDRGNASLAGPLFVKEYPNSIIYNYLTGAFYYYAKQYNKAIAYLEKTLKLKQDFLYAYPKLALSYFYKDDYDLEKMTFYATKALSMMQQDEIMYKFAIGACLIAGNIKKINAIARIAKANDVTVSGLNRLLKSLEEESTKVQAKKSKFYNAARPFIATFLQIPQNTLTNEMIDVLLLKAKT